MNVEEKIFEMYSQGHGYTAISKALSVDRTKVRRVLSKIKKKVVPLRKHVELQISDIRLDGDTQMRVTLADNTIGDYRDEMLAGAEFPPVAVYFDGAIYWLADGFHRVHASVAAGRTIIFADVYEGDARNARCHSMSANANHGLRRSNADKRNAVEMALADAEWSTLPNTKIAEMCAVAESFVRKVKQEHDSISHSASLCDAPLPETRYEAANEQGCEGAHGRLPGTRDVTPEWRFRFNPRLRRLKVLSPRGEQILFYGREELQHHISGLEQQLGLWDD